MHTLKNKKKSKIINLNFYLKKLEKEKKKSERVKLNKPKKSIIKFTMNEIKNGKK